MIMHSEEVRPRLPFGVLRAMALTEAGASADPVTLLREAEGHAFDEPAVDPEAWRDPLVRMHVERVEALVFELRAEIQRLTEQFTQRCNDLSARIGP